MSADVITGLLWLAGLLVAAAVASWLVVDLLIGRRPRR
jgi:hypothetical protein